MEGRGRTSSGGGLVRVGSGRSSRGIDEKSKEALEVVSRRFSIEVTTQTGSTKTQTMGSIDIRGGAKLESSVLCRLFPASIPPALNLRLSVLAFVSCPGGFTSVPALRIDARLPVFRNFADFIS